MLTAAKCEYLESPTNKTEEFLKQLEDLKSTIALFMNWLAEMESAKERAENLLQDEVRRKKESLEARDSAIRELEESLSAKIQDLGSQLSEKEELLESRDGQLEALRSEVNALTGRITEIEPADKQGEGFLQDELREKEEMLQARDSAIRELEESLSAKIQDLGSQVREKEELVVSRDEQLEGLRSEVNALTGRLTEMRSAKERAESLLQDELRRREEILQVKDSVIRIRELKESLSAKIQNGRSQLSQKEQVDPFEILLAKSS